MKNKKKAYKIITPKLKRLLKREIDEYMLDNGLTWTTIRAAQSVTGLPVAWRYLYIIYNEPTDKILLTPTTIFILLDFFGYELEFNFSKRNNNGEK